MHDVHEVPGIDPAHARQVLAPDADRAEWLRARRAGLGGSDIAALVGMTRYSSPFALWMDKTGRLPIDIGAPSEAARWGTLMEPVVRDEFAREHGLTIHPTGMLRSVQWPWMLANPDGLCSDGAGYEGKTTSARRAKEWADGQVPDPAELQVQWCMAVTGLARWHVVGLIGGQQALHRVIERNEALIEHLVEFSRQFWEHYVQADIEPDVDGSEATTRLLAERYPVTDPGTTAEIDPADADALRAQLAAAAETERQASEEATRLHNYVRALLGDREQLTDGAQCLATWRSTNRIAHSRLAAEHPHIAAECSRTEVHSVLDHDALRATYPEIAERYRVRQLRITTEEDSNGA